MNSVQKVIKYCAIAFAILLICGIFSGIVAFCAVMGRIAGSWNGEVSSPSSAEVVELGSDVSWQGVEELYIDVKVVNLRVEKGSEFAVRGNDEIIELKRGENAIYIEEKDASWMTGWWNWNDRDAELVVTLPEKMHELEKFHLEAGAGRVDVADVSAEYVDCNLGAGRVEMKHIVATERAEIDGGAGLLIVQESVMRNLDLYMGVGKVELGLALTGKNEIDAGVGKLELGLVDGEDAYRFVVNKGIGAITLNGENLGDNVTRGSGETLVQIEGGVGAIEVRTRD